MSKNGNKEESIFDLALRVKKKIASLLQKTEGLGAKLNKAPNKKEESKNTTELSSPELRRKIEEVLMLKHKEARKVRENYSQTRQLEDPEDGHESSQNTDNESDNEGFFEMEMGEEKTESQLPRKKLYPQLKKPYLPFPNQEQEQNPDYSLGRVRKTPKARVVADNRSSEKLMPIKLPFANIK